jgi:hypothetical protein
MKWNIILIKFKLNPNININIYDNINYPKNYLK